MKIPYIAFDVQLFNCITQEEIEITIKELKSFLVEKLNPSYHSDIIVDISESAGLNEEN